MLRVLTLATLFPSGDQPLLGSFVERQALALAALPGVGVELEVVAPSGLPPFPLSRHPHYRARLGRPAQEAWKGLRVHRPRHLVLPRIGDSWAPRLVASALLPRLREIRARFPFDLIDAQFFWPDGPAAMRLARALGVPFSVKARGADIHHWGRRVGITEQIVAAGRAANGLLAVSAAMKADMAALGIPTERIRVHHTGIDLERFRPVDRRAAKAAMGIDGPLIVTAGALIPRKGQALAIAALERIPDATLLIVGEGPDRPLLEALARPLGTRVRLLGAQPHEALPGLLAAADVLLQPSASEGLANVWVEALACGTPVVTTDVGGAREAIDRPAAGRIAAREPDALAAAARALLADPPHPGEVRRAALKFGWACNAAALFEHLSGLVEGRAARAA